MRKIITCSLCLKEKELCSQGYCGACYGYLNQVLDGEGNARHLKYLCKRRQRIKKRRMKEGAEGAIQRTNLGFSEKTINAFVMDGPLLDAREKELHKQFKEVNENESR